MGGKKEKTGVEGRQEGRKKLRQRPRGSERARRRAEGRREGGTQGLGHWDPGTLGQNGAEKKPKKGLRTLPNHQTTELPNY